MRNFSRLLLPTLLTVGGWLANAPTARAQFAADGTREAAYGAPLAQQNTPTGFGNSTQGSQTLANGSELNAAYGTVSGGVLYLLLTGNLESTGNRLEIFFDTKTGGQNVLPATNPTVDTDGLNRMAGLRFDAGFTADYYLTANATSTMTTFGLAAHFAATTGAGGTGLVLANGTTRNLALNFGAGGMGEIGLDNSNVLGVSDAAVGNPAAVATGIEFAIPLAALGNPTADFKVCAFINGQAHDFISNQVLGTLLNGTANLGDPATVSFAATAGAQYFVVPRTTRTPAPTLQLTPGSVSFGNVAVGTTATANVTVANTGTAPLTITGASTTNPVFSAVPNSTTVAPGSTVNMQVRFMPTATGAQAGTYTVASNDPLQPTLTIPLTGNGATASSIAVDGVKDAGPLYGTALALQTNATAFGDATAGNPATANGSELDAAYARIDNGTLYLLLTGNLETNGNKLELFFDTQAGGQNTLLNTNPDVNANALNRLRGLTFDGGFAPEYYMTLNATSAGGAVALAAYYAAINGAGGLGTTLTATTPGRSVALAFGGTVPAGALALDNSNIAGVSGTTVGTPATVTTGLEFGIPLAALGVTAGSGDIRITAFINGQNHDFVSNQVLAGLPAATPNLGGDGMGNFTSNVQGVNFASFAGNQFFTVANTASAITATPNPLNVGTAQVGGTPATATLTVSNPGTAPLTVSSIASSNPRFTFAPATLTVAAGGSATLTVTFTPTVAGAATGTLTLTSNAPTSPTVVNLTATGTAAPVAAITATPNPLNVGTAQVGGTPATATLTVSNPGTAPLTVSSIVSSNPRFTFAPATLTVAAGGSATLTVTFAPTVAGAATGTLTLTSNAPTSPTVVNLTATGTLAQVIVVDGSLEPNYGAALALQTTGTGFGNASLGDSLAANGSELDAAYARLDNGTLYLLLTGNLETNGNKLELFFDTQAGGQNTLLATNPDVDGGALGKAAGLQFDAGFTADYYLTVNGNAPGGVLELAASFAPVNGAGGTGTLLTAGTPGARTALNFGAGLTGRLTLNNANTAGVTDMAVGTPATVATGLEFAIPLAALGNPTGPFRIAALLNGGGHDYLSNQVLGGLPLGTGNLGGDGAGNFTGSLAGIDFNAFAGDQFFTVPNGTATPAVAVAPTALAFGSAVVGAPPVTRTFAVRNIGTAPLTLAGITASNPAFSAAPATGTVAPGALLQVTVTFAPTTPGTYADSLTVASDDPQQPTVRVLLSATATAAPTAALGLSATGLAFGPVTVGSTGTATFYVRNTGNAPLTLTGLTPSAPAFTAVPATGTVPPGDSLLVTVTFAPTAAGPATATLTLVSNDPAQPTATVALTGTGVAPAPVTVDGTRDPAPAYGPALAVQTNATGFGDATQGDPATAGGSELDAAYARLDNGTLYLLLTGNLESNGNQLEIFFDTQAGGQNTLLATNPDVDNNGLNQLAGLQFDAGFAPEYFLTLSATNPPTGLETAAHFAAVNGAGGTGLTLAAGPGRSQTLNFGPGGTGLLALDNRNVGGVSGTAVNAPAGVTTGVEWAIPLAALGNPTGPIRVTAFINGQAHDFVSNQVLAGLPTGTANLGAPATVNFGTSAGNQFFVIPNGTAPTATLGLSALSVNAGTVVVGSTGPATFYVRNTGTAPLLLSDISSSTLLFSAVPTTGTVAPGDSLLVTVTFAPTAPGVATGLLTLVSNDPSQPTTTVALSGTGLAAPTGTLVLSAPALNLGAVAVGSTATATVTVFNTGPGVLSLGSIAATNGVFTVVPGVGTNLAVGDSLVLTVTFAPTAVGAETGTLSIASNAATGTATVALTGNGVLSRAGSLTDARLSVYPNPSTGTCQVTWTGTRPLTAAADLLDAVGRLVRQVPATGAFGFALEGLRPGVYTLRLRTEAGVQLRRLVVQP